MLTLCASAAPTAARMHTISVGVALVINSAQAEMAPASAPASMAAQLEAAARCGCRVGAACRSQAA